MFEGIFPEPDVQDGGTIDEATLRSYSKRPKTISDLLEPPDKPRDGVFVGLKNQSATCYLNSLIQSYYMCPEFRHTILSLPLCDKTINKPSHFTDDAEKHKILLEFQKLFILMQQGDLFATSTEDLTKSFGWDGAEGLYQQDVQEANRVLFDSLNQALQGTQFNLTEHFTGVVYSYIQCQECQQFRGSNQTFFDLNLIVQGFENLNDSLLAYETPEQLDGIDCEVCHKRTPSLKGLNIIQPPKILTITLNRFNYDYEKNQRVKLNDKFEFPLELQIKDIVYELQAVLIHMGDAHRGHYHGYFRDTLQEGVWNQKIDEFPIEPKNPELKTRWFDFNDSSVTQIPVSKLTSQFEGSESAYILIYRSKNLIPLKIGHTLDYLEKYVNEVNAKKQKERDDYIEAQSQLVIQVSYIDIIDIQTRKIISKEVEVHKLNKYQQIADLYQIYPNGVLVEYSEDYVSKLVHFIRALNDYNKTIDEEEINHLSTWVLVQDYKQIENLVGKDRIPCQIEIIYKGQKQSVILQANQTLGELKKLVAELFQLENEFQIKNLNDNKSIITLKPEKSTLSELQIVQNTTLLVELIQQQEQQAKQIQQSDNIVSVLVERDDEYGCTKLYVDLEMTLEELLVYILQQLGLQGNRRLRKQNGNVLFYKPELALKLKDLDFEDGGVRLLVEKGDMPESGKTTISAKSTSKHTQDKEEVKDIIYDPTITIKELKLKISEVFNLDPNEHNLYLTDWLKFPVQKITDETKLANTKIREQDLIIIGDADFVAQCELIRLQVFETKTGYPDDCVFKLEVNIKKDSTVADLKKMIIQTLNLEIDLPRFRLREINKIQYFENVLKKNNEQLRKINFKTQNLVFQILDHDEQLVDGQILLLLKRRNVENKIYTDFQDLIYDYKSGTKVEDLKKAIRAKLNIEDQHLELSKFIAHEFTWLHMVAAGKIQDNLKKHPFQLRDGDFIGYRIGLHPKDDFQTEADQELKELMKRKKRPNESGKGKKRNQEDGFQIKLQFLDGHKKKIIRSYNEITEHAQMDGSYDEKLHDVLSLRSQHTKIELTILALKFLETNFDYERDDWQMFYEAGFQYLLENNIDYENEKLKYKI